MRSINDSAFLNIFNYQNNQKLDISVKEAKNEISGLLDSTANILTSISGISSDMVALTADVTASALKIADQEVKNGLFDNLFNDVQSTASDLSDDLKASNL